MGGNGAVNFGSGYANVNSRDLAAAYVRVCDLELQALKPGNVHVHAAGHGMCVEDFRASARASAAALAARGQALGPRIYRAVAATRTVCGCNTNLGIVLLAAPVIMAAQQGRGVHGFRGSLEDVLRHADVTDSEWINRAIRLAAPAGLGWALRHDVYEGATAPVQEVMAEAADRDAVARQFATGYADLFEFAVPRWRELYARWGSDVWATAGLYLGLLARLPDSHVARKHGASRAKELTAKAAGWEAALLRSSMPDAGSAALLAVDKELKTSAINPGTTADLTVAALLIVFVEALLSPSDRMSVAGAGACH